jgi:alkanesulfonate monooxygenase SsuD/methylene tetrahydromethanopterin reductase-like flavin-dependent oxidoreductase (luciferase family)
MPDLGHDLCFGAFLTPDAGQRDRVLALATMAEDLGLDLLTFQDHPYQPGFLDTWTLLSFLAARTSRIRLAPNVLNVPLRPPAVLARSAAALDLLSGGRVDLGLGAGHFLDAMSSMGAPTRSAGELVDGLEEAILILRALWRPGPPVHFDGAHHRLRGAQPGPIPAHPISIWVGAYKARMLALTGRLGDGWVPTLAYAGPEELGRMTRLLDEAARDAGREPAEIRRLYNIAGTFGERATGYLQGPPSLWAEQLTELVLTHGMSGFILGPGSDAAGDLRRFAEEVAPAVAEAVAQARTAPAARPAADVAALAVDRGAEDLAVSVDDRPAQIAVDEAQRLVHDEEPVSAAGRAGQQTLLGVHEHLRQELEQLRAVVQQVADGQRSAAAARGHLNDMAMRQNYWTLGSFCTSYCRVVATHHAIEDARMFPDLRAADANLGEVLDRLQAEHEVIADLLDGVDRALVAMVEDERQLTSVHQAVDALAQRLLIHLDDEEAQLLGPIGRLSIHV